MSRDVQRQKVYDWEDSQSWMIKNSYLSQKQCQDVIKRLNKIFNGKKVGVNQLRHTYLTDKFADTIKKEKAIADTMEDMGSSKEMLKTYVKKE